MRVDTICTHGDTPSSHELTRQLRAALEADGIVVASAGSAS
jgi:lactam utilization protein B